MKGAWIGGSEMFSESSYLEFWCFEGDSGGDV